MNDLIFEIVKFIYNSQCHQSTKFKIHKTFYNIDNSIGIILRDMLKAENPLICMPYGNDIIKLTRRGISAYQSEKAARNSETLKNTKEKKENRSAVIISVISLILGAIGTAVSILQLFF